MSTTIETIQDLRDRIEGNPFAMVTSADDRGTLSSRPLTIQKFDDDGNLWFLVDRNSDWVAPVDGAAVNAAVADDDDTWVSFAGRGKLVNDHAVIEELKDPMSETYFDDDSVIVALMVESDRIEWWASANKAVMLYELAKAKLTGERPDIGDSGTIES